MTLLLVFLIPQKKSSIPFILRELNEIISLTGTVTRQDGEVYLHLHMAAGDKDGHVFGGHLNMAYISATAEIQIQIIDGTINRKYDEKNRTQLV